MIWKLYFILPSRIREGAFFVPAIEPDNKRAALFKPSVLATSAQVDWQLDTSIASLIKFT